MSDSDQSSIDSNLTQSLNTLLEKSSEELYNEAMLEKKEGKHRQNEDESMLDEPRQHRLSLFDWVDPILCLRAKILEEMKIKSEADAADNITLQAEIKE